MEQVVSQLCACKPGGTTGEWDRPHNPGLQYGQINPQSLWLETPVGVEAVVGETPSFTGEFVGDPQGPRVYQIHPPRNQHQKGPIWLCIAGEVTENWQRAEQASLFLLDSSPTYSITTKPRVLPHPGENLSINPLLHNRHTETKKSSKWKNRSKLQKKYN